jgi:altronate hydrolase/altronate dehydratase small subunit
MHSSPARCFQIHVDDNVATLLDVAAANVALRVLGQESDWSLIAREPVQLAHKIALKDIPAGEMIVKFGVPIGHATKDIPAGSWVHLHNCTSLYDARSQTLDVHTGATTDTRYE